MLLCTAGFPWLGALVFAPCALLAALGVQVPITASVMTLDMLWNSASLIWNQLCALSSTPVPNLLAPKFRHLTRQLA